MACDVPGCPKNTHGNALCPMHYARKRKTGSVGPVSSLYVERIASADDFWAKVAKGPDCWTWGGTIHASGYGQGDRGRDARHAGEVAHRRGSHARISGGHRRGRGLHRDAARCGDLAGGYTEPGGG